MLRRIVTSDRLRKKAQSDDLAARLLIEQAGEVNAKARAKREQALALDREEAAARLHAEVYRTGQALEKADGDATVAGEDANAALAISAKAQQDFEAAVTYADDVRG